MKALGLLVLFLGCTVSALSQTLLSNAGGYHTNANGSLTFSVGEPLSSTFSSGNQILTQGFNQTRLTITEIDKNELGSSDLKAYPNPTNQFMILEFVGENNEGKKACRALLFDGAGKLVNDFQILGQTNSLDMSAFANGAYTLKLMDKQDKNLKTFRVVIVK